MGLNEIYTVTRGQILLLNLLPSLDQDYSLLLQDEKKENVLLAQLLLFQSPLFWLLELILLPGMLEP